MPEFDQRYYDEEDAEQILRLASSMSSPVGAMSRDRLLETAAELGITPEAVAMAEKQYASSKVELSDRAEFDRRLRRDFYGHLASYLIVNGFLCGINLYSGGYFWAIWPLLGWGIGLAFSVVETFFRNSESYQQEFDKWRARRQRLQNRNLTSVENSDFLIEKFVQRRFDRGREFNKIDAIRYLREKSGMNLSEAKASVEQYMIRNPDLFD